MWNDRFPVVPADSLKDAAPDAAQEEGQGLTIHRFDKEKGKVLQPVSVDTICAEVRTKKRDSTTCTPLSN
ncbi:hypothetical protein NCLIV_066470 [Neospora caninum Liverpool]|uniref:Uncharacterized protein n=1 Tax=Neospora caninum (strain Liverpool) TaxID=572307 RepID=F0VR74_NEOCL|nr:hypothetical protein NCLIV_066470 [Neospora caninum Liverpool]CBZ56222.1 hypothetical protein NCLIV_066470 [Neospora caninum Liverpool]|eukprot:XP_003886247.1 hypothetical protein NCLIV_066470 [Neospora caninum Liverpool]